MAQAVAQVRRRIRAKSLQALPQKDRVELGKDARLLLETCIRQPDEPLETLYSMKYDRVSIHNQGRMLLRDFNGSVADLVMTAYPEHKWHPWRFAQLDIDWWRYTANQRVFMETLRRKHGWTLLDGLYNLHQRQIFEFGGGTLLFGYKASISDIVTTLYPEHKWLPWKFVRPPFKWWNHRENQLAFMTWLRKRLSMNELKDCYDLTINSIVEHGGWVLPGLYNNSPHQILQALYPSHEWLPWLFSHAPAKFWSNVDNQLMYMEWLRKKMNWATMEDLYNVSYSTFEDCSGTGLLKQYKSSPVGAVMALYPSHAWQPWRFAQVQKGWWVVLENQRIFLRWLQQQVGLKFPTRAQFYEHGGAGLLRKYYYDSPKLLFSSLMHHYEFSQSEVMPIDDQSSLVPNELGLASRRRFLWSIMATVEYAFATPGTAALSTAGQVG